MLTSGNTIGILGGGQLGRMLAIAAAQLGLRVHIYAPDEDSVAAEVAAQFTCAAWDDAAALAQFANECDAITFEFENIEVGPLAILPPAKLAPNLRALETAQDRLLEKNFVAGLGGSPAVAYDADWQPEFVEDGLNGFIVPLHDWQAMGRRAAQLLGDETLRGRMSAAMRVSALARANRKAIACHEHDVFDAVLGRDV